MIINLYSAKSIEEYSKAPYCKLKKKHKNYSNKLKAFLKRNFLSCFLKMARLLLVLKLMAASSLKQVQHEQRPDPQV